MGTAQQSHLLKSFFLIEHGVHQQDASEKLIVPEPIQPFLRLRYVKMLKSASSLEELKNAAARRGDAGRFMIVPPCLWDASGMRREARLPMAFMTMEFKRVYCGS